MLEIYFIGFLGLLFFFCANGNYTREIRDEMRQIHGTNLKTRTILWACALWPITLFFMFKDYKGEK
jgi:hypothetical protein